MTTRFTLYIMQAPVHISHGERVVYIVAPRYVVAERRPAFSKADISAWGKWRQAGYTEAASNLV